MHETTRKLIRKLRTIRKRPSIVVLPDLFIDHIISIKKNSKWFTRELQRVAGQGGGNIVAQSQQLQMGGNAANTASQLDSLGAEVRLIAATDTNGRALAALLWKGRTQVLSRLKTTPSSSMTAALEFFQGERLVNVMLSNPGPASSFRPDLLNAADWGSIETADCVCVVNWNLNMDGTKLARAVFKHARRQGRARTFLDVGDLSTRSASDLRDLLRDVLRKGLVDVLSLNENEALTLHARLGLRPKRGGKTGVLKCASELGEVVHCRVDLHTAAFSASIEEDAVHEAPAFRVKPIRVTGAGDAWNGANVYADLIGLDPRERLLFANAAAAYHVSAPGAGHATRERLARFLRNHA